LNTLYKKPLAEDKIEDEQLEKLLKDYDSLTKKFKIETDKVFELDKKIQALTSENETLANEVSRLKLQKFTFNESLVFLFNSLRGGGLS
jgi:uncharacterized protein YhaN